MGMPDSFCVICNVNLDVSTCINIFYTYLPCNGELLASFALRVLRPATSNLNSSYICSHCYKLFQMLEQAQWTVMNIRCEILKVYQSGEKKKFVRHTFTNNTDGLLHNTKIFENIQTTKRDIDQTINETPNITTDESTFVMNRSFMQDVSLEQNLQTLNTDIINMNNIKNIEFSVNSEDTFKEETEVDIKNLENINSNIKNNTDCNMEYVNNSNVKKHIKTEIHNKVTDLNVKMILENDYHNSILNNKNTSQQNNVDQEISCNQCKFCIESFNTEDELNVHLLKHNDIQLYQCCKCKEVFTNISLANTHFSKTHAEEQDCTNILPVSYKNEIGHFLNDISLFSQSNTEALNNIKSIGFDCTESNKNLSEIKENSTCSVENKLNKNNADAKTKANLSSASWKSGRISKYSLKPLKYTCSTCGKKWRTSAELKTHVKSHSNVRPYMCEKCGQAYKHKHALEIHIGMHNGINPFQCSFCKKCFTQKGALMRHLPMHTGETPYQCELCGKRFIHHTSYNMHALSHTGKKSYQCHICDLSLLSTSHLKRHMRVHTGEKPYSCILCGKRFAERYNLLAHQKIHSTSESTTKDVGKLQNMCSQYNTLYKKGQACTKHMKQQCNTDDNITISKEVSSFNCSSQSLEQSKLHNKTQQQPPKNQNSDDSKAWVEINESKFHGTSNETELLLLQDSALQYDTASVGITFDDHKMSLPNRNYNTSLKIIIESSNVSIPNNNQIIIDEAHT